MILQDMRRHLFRTLYFVYAVYEKKNAVSEATAETVIRAKHQSYWVARDYEVVNGQFVLVDPFTVLADSENVVGMWMISTYGDVVNSGPEIYRLEGPGSEGLLAGYEFTYYKNTEFWARPGNFVRKEQTLEANLPANGPQGNYWYELIGTTESQEIEWYWEYTRSGVFVPHTSGVYRVTCIGGGGGGGSGGKGENSMTSGSADKEWGGGGGGSGSAGKITTKDLLLTEDVSYAIQVGSGGRGGNRGDGTFGGTSSFGSLVQGTGGAPGKKGGDATSRGGGSGGSGGNSGGSGKLNEAGTGGKKETTSNSSFNRRLRNGTGGPGGKGGLGANSYGSNGQAGHSGVVVIEFRGT